MGWASKTARKVRNTVSSACKSAWNATTSLGHLAAAVVTLNPTQLDLALRDATQAVDLCVEAVEGAVTILAWAGVAAFAAFVGVVIYATVGIWGLVGYMLCMAVAFCWKHVWKFLKVTGQKLVDAVKRIVKGIISFVASVIPWYVWAILAAVVVGPSLLGGGSSRSKPDNRENSHATPSPS